MAYATDWKEEVQGDEEARFAGYAEELRAMQRRRAAVTGKTSRALHAKANLGLAAELTVLPDVPDDARIGLFAEPATYKAYVRFSNGVGRRQSDRKPDIRGVAVKVVGVPGRKIIPGMEDAKTQDFLLIRTPSTAVKDAREFLTLVRAAETPALVPLRLLFRVGPGRALAIVRGIAASLKLPRLPLASTPFYSASPIAYGPHAVKYALIPHDHDPPVRGGSDDWLGAGLAARIAKGPVVYDLRVQFFRDAKATPIEDHAVEWKAEDAPFVTVARLTIPEQDPSSPRGEKIRAYVERLAFDPWHAREDLRPLGNMMRARNHAYRLSTEERGAAKEPDGSETFDAG